MVKYVDRLWKLERCGYVQERTSASMLFIKMRRNGCSEFNLEEISPILYEHFFPLLILLCILMNSFSCQTYIRNLRKCQQDRSLSECRWLGWKELLRISTHWKPYILAHYHKPSTIWTKFKACWSPKNNEIILSIIERTWDKIWKLFLWSYAENLVALETWLWTLKFSLYLC